MRGLAHSKTAVVCRDVCTDTAWGWATVVFVTVISTIVVTAKLQSAGYAVPVDALEVNTGTGPAQLVTGAVVVPVTYKCLRNTPSAVLLHETFLQFCSSEPSLQSEASWQT